MQLGYSMATDKIEPVLPNVILHLSLSIIHVLKMVFNFGFGSTS